MLNPYTAGLPGIGAAVSPLGAGIPGINPFAAVPGIQALGRWPGLAKAAVPGIAPTTYPGIVPTAVPGVAPGAPLTVAAAPVSAVGLPVIACQPLFGQIANVCSGAVPTTAWIPTRVVTPVTQAVAPVVEFGQPVVPQSAVPVGIPAVTTAFGKPGAFGKGAGLYSAAPVSPGYLATQEAIVDF